MDENNEEIHENHDMNVEDPSEEENGQNETPIVVKDSAEPVNEDDENPVLEKLSTEVLALEGFKSKMVTPGASLSDNSPTKEPEKEAPGAKRVMSQVIVDEMKASFLDYAMSVIVSRALPDVRDGLKPVHRRILYAMNEMGMLHDKPYKKSARIVGEVLGKYHPHGDTAVYDAMVRMAQAFSLRYTLVDGQGNFGSVDGDSAAAMRYTEARLDKRAEEILDDIKKDTVDFVPNFDGSLKEPSVLPSKIPNLLVNGSSGIAVGMATNIPPHNLTEVADGTVYLIDNPECSVKDLMSFIKGPDFPTGARIYGRGGIKSAYLSGRGRICIRARAEIEEAKNKQKIIIREIPYMVNKSMLIEQIADIVRDKRITGISDIRDESDREGMRIVVELKSGANPDILLNQLYKHSRLQVTFGVIMLALVDNAPRVLNLKQMLQSFIRHRQVIVRRRTEFDLNKAKKRLHIVEGLIVALDNIDPMIKLIKDSKGVNEAKNALMTNYSLTEIQAQAILEMRLQKLTGLEQDKIKEEHASLLKLIEELSSILASEQKILDIIKSELLDIKEKYGDERRTEIVEGQGIDIEVEDLIEEENMVVTITHSGYIKRVPLSIYKQQRRGGKGIIATNTREEDFVEHLFTASTHSYILFFTDKGKVYWLKVYNLPQGSRTSLGKAIVNLLSLDKDEKITTFIPVKEFNDGHFLLMATRKGIVKKTSISAYSRPRRGGIIAVDLVEGDHLVNVVMTSGEDQIMLATQNGMAVRFSETDVRPVGRGAKGVRGIKLRKGDVVVGIVKTDEQNCLLTITENGYGKRTKITDYRLINRGGIGVRNIICSERNGRVIGVMDVEEGNEVMLISKDGIIIRIPVNGVSVIGRNTQGVRLMKLNPGDKVVATAKLVVEDEDVDGEDFDGVTDGSESSQSSDPNQIIETRRQVEVNEEVEDAEEIQDIDNLEDNSEDERPSDYA